MSASQGKMFQGENLNDFLQHRGALEGQKKITSLKICTTNLQLRGPNFTPLECTFYIKFHVIKHGLLTSYLPLLVHVVIE